MMKPIVMNFWGETALDQLQRALDSWNNKYEQIFDILTTSPSEFQNGGIWTAVSDVIRVIEGTGITLVVLFFLYGLFKSSIDLRDFRHNPKQIIFSLFRLVIAQFFVKYSTTLLTYVMVFAQNLIKKIDEGVLTADFTVPPDLQTALETADWGAGMGAYAASLIGTAVIFLLSIIIIVVVYGRFFKIFLLASISPIPLAGFASDATETLGINFMKSFVGECIRGVVILVACIIFSAFATSPTGLDASTPGGMTWTYIGEVITQMLLLVIIVKTSDRLIKEIFGF